MDIDKIPPLTHVKVKVNGTEFKGKLLPKEGESYVLKLDSGYNVGILSTSIDSVEILEEANDQQPVTNNNSIIQNKDLPVVKILHTGGTIASKIDYKTGAVVAKFDPKELVAMFPELTNHSNVESELVRNMQSDDFRFAHFNLIAKKILQDYNEKSITRFIVTSGTDFLHYLSSSLSFILKDVPVGVLVVGAQRSSDRGSSDASMNLFCANLFLAEREFKGVATCLHETTEDENCLIIPGTQVRKMHSTRRDAFKPINGIPYARVNYTTRLIEEIKEIPKANGNESKELHLIKEDLKIGMLYSRPQMFPEEFSFYQNFDGLVLVGSGLGHFPITNFDEISASHEKHIEIIRELCKKMPVAISVQTIYGRTHLNVYSPQRVLQDAGVIGHLSVMTPETSYIKLAWLISNYKKDEVKELFMHDFVGELNSDEPLHF